MGDTTEENKRKALEALESRGSRHDAATAADVCLKTLDDWRRRDAQFAAEWDATIDRVMKRLREQPLDDKGNFRRSPLQYGLKATPENKEIVLAMLSNGATYAAAAAAIGAHRRTIIKWPDRDEEFAKRWKDAVEQGIDRLEEEAIRRAVDGVDRPVFFQGRIVGYTKEYSDTLLKFLLEAKRPAVYRARNINVMPLDGSGGVLEVRWKESESPQERQPADKLRQQALATLRVSTPIAGGPESSRLGNRAALAGERRGYDRPLYPLTDPPPI